MSNKEFQNGFALGMVTGGVNESFVDQTYNPESENAQSGKAIAEALANIKVPSVYSYSTAKLTTQKVFENEENSPNVLTIKVTQDDIGVGISFELFLAKKENEEIINLVNHPFPIALDTNGQPDISRLPLNSINEISYMVGMDGSIEELGLNFMKTAFVDGETITSSEMEYTFGNDGNACSFGVTLWLIASSREIATAFKEEYEALFQAAEAVKIYYIDFKEITGG